MPKANNTEPIAMLPMAIRFRVQSLGPHRMARDISASSEKNLFNMAGEQIWAKERGQRNSIRAKPGVVVPFDSAAT